MTQRKLPVTKGHSLRMNKNKANATIQMYRTTDDKHKKIEVRVSHWLVKVWRLENPRFLYGAAPACTTDYAYLAVPILGNPPCGITLSASLSRASCPQHVWI